MTVCRIINQIIPNKIQFLSAFLFVLLNGTVFMRLVGQPEGKAQLGMPVIWKYILKDMIPCSRVHLSA
jgi:hypothetical protein